MRFPPSLSSIVLACLVAGCSACTSAPPAEPPTAEAPATSTAISPPGTGAGEPVPEFDPGLPPTLEAPDGELVAAELSTVGFDALSGAPVVLLRELESGQVVPIWIGLAEARAILQALYGIEAPRPQTHDLTASLIRHLGAALEEVVVTELRGGTYYGRLKLRLADGGEVRWIDTRPSDGLALALRTGARILVAADLLEGQPELEFIEPQVPDQVVRILGLTVRAATPELREEYGLDDSPGLVVISATGEARRRGLERGDLIVDVEGKVPERPLDLLDAIRASPQGILTLTYRRDGEEKTIQLEVDAESPERRGEDRVA